MQPSPAVSWPSPSRASPRPFRHSRHRQLRRNRAGLCTTPPRSARKRAPPQRQAAVIISIAAGQRHQAPPPAAPYVTASRVTVIDEQPPLRIPSRRSHATSPHPSGRWRSPPTSMPASTVPSRPRTADGVDWPGFEHGIFSASAASGWEDAGRLHRLLHHSRLALPLHRRGPFASPSFPLSHPPRRCRRR